MQKVKCLYLKYILTQNEEGLLKNVFSLQLDHHTRGDWARTCMNDLKDLKIFKLLPEIKEMSDNQNVNLLNDGIAENALKYFTNKQRRKGKEII